MYKTKEKNNLLFKTNFKFFIFLIHNGISNKIKDRLVTLTCNKNVKNIINNKISFSVNFCFDIPKIENIEMKKYITPTAISGFPTIWISKKPLLPPPIPKLSKIPNIKTNKDKLKKYRFLLKIM